MITLVGLSHRTTPIERREKFCVQPERVPELLAHLRHFASESFVLSTCNRFEILIRQDEDDVRPRIFEFIENQFGLSRSEFEQYLYWRHGLEAIQHVFRVASSLDSMVVGEPQILGQMKRSFTLAQSEKSTGTGLHTLMERAFAVAKKVRSETEIGSHPVSVSSVAVEVATTIFESLTGKTALVIGAGKMSLLALQHLRSHGVGQILITNRTFEKAEELAGKINGRAVPFEDFRNYLPESDIVISSTGSRHYIVNEEDVAGAMAKRKKPMFLVDIALPRDLDPQIQQIPNAFLYDLDDLEKVADSNRSEREKEAEKAEQIVQREANFFWKKFKTLDANPTIREIQTRVQEVRRQELEAALPMLGTITQEQRQSIEKLVDRLANKILQNSFQELRTIAAQDDGLDKILFIRKLFGLSGATGTVT